ncbi:class I SAM-dependent methyltransferase [Streptococcus loxodontisalivarius]|uniref:Ubiquinone/menaquinone biosynthesis C-methylase UbiE n=1 Tax=Streptococcus loxodontisalivarius TaxID=1349415 RepID=A0ABS2PQ46_9STRE|nr:class I SAM-dependent methyltransferase [Streptococcus loxodontisalivarius]MBM7642168.1 ubiquinone/menaquinone biosynthesis C-methylase UbiE [Streptococcus loxodontisalivarius]
MTEERKRKEVGHNFLAKLGKKRLRPGGITATNWLIEHSGISKESKVLEVACNMCTTSIELAQTFGCQIEGVDMDKKALEKASKNIKEAGLEDKIHIQQANAMKLPFEDNSFDLVINEAMLTMLRGEAKKKAIAEYLRVLKPGGKLLTHDVSYIKPEMEDLLGQLSQTINANVEPLSVDKWQSIFKEVGFTDVQASYGKMTLMSTWGMIKDEGLLGTCLIVYRGLKKENRQQFLTMYRFFNKTAKDLRYIAVVSQK